MTFPVEAPNCRALPLIHALFPTLPEILPPIPNDNASRLLRIGQYWSSQSLQGEKGHIIEILGFTSPLTFHGRRWIPMIPRDSWFPTDISLNARLTKHKIWLRPLTQGSSRGAGSTETFYLSDLLTDHLCFKILGPEIRSTYFVDNDCTVDGIARQLIFSTQERRPLLATAPTSDTLTSDPQWILLAAEQLSSNVEVYVDGSMRFPPTALDHVFPQPKSHQKATYAQGGILYRFNPTVPVSTRQQDITMITTDGHRLGLSSPSSIEIYTILLAIHCMEVASLTGTIYTDFLKAVKVSKDPTLLAKMGREGNLPLLEYMIILLGRNPLITLTHVKAHGDFKKNQDWTRPQWGITMLTL